MDTEMARAANPRRISDLVYGAVLGALTSLPVIALSYLGAKAAGLTFFPFDLFDWLARVLPGNIITIGIDSMVRVIGLLGVGPTDAVAKMFEQSMGVLLVIVIGAVLGAAIAFTLARTASAGRSTGTTFGVGLFLIVAAIEIGLKGLNSSTVLFTLVWTAILIVGWGRLLGGWLARAETVPVQATPPPGEISRRELLVKLAGGSVAVAVVAAGLGRWLEMATQARGAGQPLGNVPPPNNPVAGAPTLAPTPLAQATEQALDRSRIPAAPGTRPDLTPTEDFYRIDINTLPPVLDKNSWKLDVKGLFDKPRSLTLADLLAYPAVTQPITQQCISNPVAGDLIGTTYYTGPRLRDVLQDLGLRPTAKALEVRGADGFYESVEMQDMMDERTLLVYGMNGTTLPTEHGFPLRIYIANRYGMKQPKWITSIEAIDGNGPGYWVERGWSAEARPQIISVIDAVAKDKVENGKVPVGGIAWAGDRGIQKVEVQVDRGDWTEATLRMPPLGPLTWVQWRYDWPVAKGTHTFRVRATDGTGTVQTIEPADTYPNGATGYHEVTVTI